MGNWKEFLFVEKNPNIVIKVISLWFICLILMLSFSGYFIHIISSLHIISKGCSKLDYLDYVWVYDSFDTNYRKKYFIYDEQWHIFAKSRRHMFDQLDKWDQSVCVVLIAITSVTTNSYPVLASFPFGLTKIDVDKTLSNKKHSIREKNKIANIL